MEIENFGASEHAMFGSLSAVMTEKLKEQLRFFFN